MPNSERFGLSRFLKVVLRLASLCLLATLAAQAQTYTIVHSFAGAPNDGAFANGELVQDPDGNVYGTTYEGGTNNFGTVFKLDPEGNETVLYSFTGGANDGANPLGGLLRDAEGNLYGTTSTGTDAGGGALFELDANNTFRRIFKFGLAGTGNGPVSRLVTNEGDLYGVTQYGGLLSQACQQGAQLRCGIIYKMTKGGTQTVLYSFTGGVDGASPRNLTRDAEGNLYGVATSASLTTGTVWKLDSQGVFTVLYSFTGGSDGGEPLGRLIQDSNGNLHGTTISGGDPICKCGVVFRLDNSNNETVVHKFFGHGGGSNPAVGVLDHSGVLYGTTESGGTGWGVFYQISRTGQYVVLHRFGGSSAGDGADSSTGALSLGTDGNIYGATSFGGTGTACQNPNGCGTIFKYTP